jgi:hypothetical protein
MSRRVALASTDGATWTIVVPLTQEGTIADIAWDPVSGRFVVVGTDAEGQPFAWLSLAGAVTASD